ncbi:MAG TPA: TIGR02757 family protein [Candidatus Anoxymicrobiaceae bacterium]
MHPDPLEFLYDYPDVADREIVGLVASSLAYGRVAQLLKSIRVVLDIIGPRPVEFVASASAGSLEKSLSGFKHRFTTGSQIAGLLAGARGAIEKYGSLNGCFTSGMEPSEHTVLEAMNRFATELTGSSGCPCDFLLPSVAKGSACKRLNLYLRWMVRSDEVDPGGWSGVSPAALIVPLDTHMYRTGQAMGFTTRKSADIKAAQEVTEGFRRIVPEDPVRYDFSLTRLGIRSESSLEEFLGGIEETQG